MRHPLVWVLMLVLAGVPAPGVPSHSDGRKPLTETKGARSETFGDLWENMWQPVDGLALEATWTDIALASQGDAWGVGAVPYDPDAGTFLLRWEAGQWTSRQIKGSVQLRAIDLLDGGEAWAVGEDTAAADPQASAVVWHLRAGDWTPDPVASASALHDVDMIASDDGWAVGLDGTILHYDGQSWTVVESPTYGDLFGVHFAAPDDGWAVGSALRLIGPPRYQAVVLHYDGRSWEQVEVPPGPPRLLEVRALARDDVWAVGRSGAILHYDGQEWVIVQGQKEYRLLGLTFGTARDGWAVGTEGRILHYDGRSWTPAVSGTTKTLFAVAAQPPGTAWAVGGDETGKGIILYHPPGVKQELFLPLIGR